MLGWEKIVVGDLQTNCYLVFDEDSKEAVVIDPGDSGTDISMVIEELKLRPKGIWLTHAHFDHVLGIIDLKLIYSIPVLGQVRDEFLLKLAKKSAEYWLRKKVEAPVVEKFDDYLTEGQELRVGENIVRIMETPGHTPGGVCFYSQGQKVLFSGDTVFAGCRGRTDLPYSSTEDILASIDKILKLPGETVILSGHGKETTVAEETGLYLST